MLSTADERAGEVLAGEHPAAGHLRHRAEPRRATLRRVRQVLREPGAHGQGAAAAAGQTCLRYCAQEVSSFRW